MIDIDIDLLNVENKNINVHMSHDLIMIMKQITSELHISTYISILHKKCQAKKRPGYLISALDSFTKQSETYKHAEHFIETKNWTLHYDRFHTKWILFEVGAKG